MSKVVTQLKKKSFSEEEILRKFSTKKSSILVFECLCVALLKQKANITAKPSNCWSIQLLVSNMPDWMVATHTEILAYPDTPSIQSGIHCQVRSTYVPCSVLTLVNRAPMQTMIVSDAYVILYHYSKILKGLIRFFFYFQVSTSLVWIKVVNNSFLFNVGNSWIPIITCTFSKHNNQQQWIPHF